MLFDIYHISDTNTPLEAVPNRWYNYDSLKRASIRFPGMAHKTNLLASDLFNFAAQIEAPDLREVFVKASLTGWNTSPDIKKLGNLPNLRKIRLGDVVVNTSTGKAWMVGA